MSSPIHKVTKRLSIGHFFDLKIALYTHGLSKKNFEIRKNPMAIFANDYIGIQINQFGFFELDELEFLFDFLAPLNSIFIDGLAYDVGANIGNHSIYFSRIFKLVHSFEPNPSTYQLLSFNAKHMGNVVAHNYGLGDVKGNFDLLEDPTNIGLSSIKFGDKSANKIVKIGVKRLDDIEVDSIGLCLIKIDVEGFEPNVIRGGSNTIIEHQPLIVLEQHEIEFFNDSTESISLLRDMGYKFCWQKKGRPSKYWLGRRLHDLKEIISGKVCEMVTADYVPKNSYTMLIAVPPRFQVQLGLK